MNRMASIVILLESLIQPVEPATRASIQEIFNPTSELYDDSLDEYMDELDDGFSTQDPDESCVVIENKLHA